tara:strand:- start:875 stop:976 length:102 start_codon:yes stop_codon:yes gene_type:complete
MAEIKLSATNSRGDDGNNNSHSSMGSDSSGGAC